MPRYQKKPVVIEAERVSVLHSAAARDWNALPKWVAEAYQQGNLLFACRPDRIEVRTLEGTMTAHVGDVLIRGVKGEIYPCKPDIFAETYRVPRIAGAVLVRRSCNIGV